MHAQIPHQNNQMLNKLVGTKRRKIGEDPHVYNNTLPAHQHYYTGSLNSSTKGSHMTHHQTVKSSACNDQAASSDMIVMSDYNDTSFIDSYQFESDSVDYKKVKKRQQNKESALRTRMKKKAYFENIES